MKLRKSIQTVTLPALFIITFILTACNNQTDEVYEFFRNTELQYETPAQKKYILEALNDITNLDLSEDELKQKRYEDYMGKEFQWSSQELISYHFVPSDKNITLGNNFYSHLKRKEVHETIQDIIRILESNVQTYNNSSEEQDYDIIVGNNIKFDIGNDDIGKEEKLVIFTLVVTNLSDTIPVPVLSIENVSKHAIFFNNNKEVFNPASRGGLEVIREKEVLSKDESDYYTCRASVDYLKNEYGNVFTVQWKYLNIYSSISEVNLEKETIERQ